MSQRTINAIASMIDKLKAIPILFALWIVNTLFRCISVETTWNLGECIGTLCHKIMPKRRAIIAYNMEVISAHSPDIKNTPELVKEIFQRNCANLLCSVKTYGMTPEQLRSHVTVETCPEFQQAVANNTGAILCLAHMGNWEVLSKIATHLDPTPENFGAIYRPLDSKAADDYVAKQRQGYGCQMFPKSTPMGILSTFIREGGVLGILADQRAGQNRKNARPFFGQNSARSKLPAVLHLRTGAPLFSVTMYSEQPARWVITVSPIRLDHAKQTTDEVVNAITTSYEESFSSYFLDPFWLHRYWVTNRKKR